MTAVETVYVRIHPRPDSVVWFLYLREVVYEVASGQIS